MNPIFSLEGKIALITGGGSGIGNAIAKCMIAAGGTVVITGRREAPLQEAVAELGEKAHYVVNDVTDLSQLEALVAVSYTHLDVYKRQLERVSGVKGLGDGD